MAILHDFGSSWQDKINYCRDMKATGRQFVLVMNDTINDYYAVTSSDFFVAFDNRQDLFERLTSKLSYPGQYSIQSIVDLGQDIERQLKRELQTESTKSLGNDINSYLETRRDVTDAERLRSKFSYKARAAFGLNPDEKNRVTVLTDRFRKSNEGYFDTSSKSTLPYNDKALAISVALGKIAPV